MSKINVLNNLNAFDAISPANDDSLPQNDNCESNIISLSQYRERIKSIDKTPPCALAKAA